MTDRGTPTPIDATSPIKSREYADLRARAAAPDFRGLLFEIEAAVEPPPFLGAKVNRLANVTPIGPHPINLRRDAREIVGYLDRVLTPTPYDAPQVDQTVRVGDQIALKKMIYDNKFVIELWKALSNPPEDATAPSDITDPTRVTRLIYNSYKFGDKVGYIEIDDAEVVDIRQRVVHFDTPKRTFTSQPSTFLFRGPNYERARRLKIRDEIGHDIWDPRYKTQPTTSS